MHQSNKTCLNNRQRNWFIIPTKYICQWYSLMRPNQNFNQFLPVSSPRNQKYKSCGINKMSKKKYPSPYRQTIYSKRIISINQLRRIQPQIIAKPTYQICRRFIKLIYITFPNTQIFPMPIKSNPTNCIQYPKESQIKRIPRRNITCSSTSGPITRKTITKIFFIRYKFRFSSIKYTFYKNQSSYMQTQRNSMMNKKIARTNRNKKRTPDVQFAC